MSLQILNEDTNPAVSRSQIIFGFRSNLARPPFDSVIAWFVIAITTTQKTLNYVETDNHRTFLLSPELEDEQCRPCPGNGSLSGSSFFRLTPGMSPGGCNAREILIRRLQSDCTI